VLKQLSQKKLRYKSLKGETGLEFDLLKNQDEAAGKNNRSCGGRRPREHVAELAGPASNWYCCPSLNLSARRARPFALKCGEAHEEWGYRGESVENYAIGENRRRGKMSEWARGCSTTPLGRINPWRCADGVVSLGLV